jgi:hypothetical protein
LDVHANAVTVALPPIGILALRSLNALNPERLRYGMARTGDNED